MIDGGEAGFDEKCCELGVFEVIGDVGNADFFAGDLMTEENLRVTALIGGVEAN